MHCVLSNFFLVILSLDDILCVTLSILCQHLEKLKTLCTKYIFSMKFGPAKLKEYSKGNMVLKYIYICVCQ